MGSSLFSLVNTLHMFFLLAGYSHLSGISIGLDLGTNWQNSLTSIVRHLVVRTLKDMTLDSTTLGNMTP
jgi:hypothetical protein